MKIFAFIGFSILLTGCVYQSIDQQDLKTAIKACEQHEGVWSITSSWTGKVVVACKDGESFRVDQYSRL